MHDAKIMSTLKTKTLKKSRVLTKVDNKKRGSPLRNSLA
jgi:hypothetical protein